MPVGSSTQTSNTKQQLMFAAFQAAKLNAKAGQINGQRWPFIRPKGGQIRGQTPANFAANMHPSAGLSLSENHAAREPVSKTGAASVYRLVIDTGGK